ncbi:uncharacterized protein LOC143215108 isoform X3 [Lasioglossum baleicum]|uniref:uncharacterized protein LOC143215108 isoform X3 n=1 Tax=Lasioglossum baleicum TaxID=434251 RepID=UPI003FCE7362
MIVAAGETPLDAPRNAQSHTEPKNDVTEMINPVKCGLHVNEREKNQNTEHLRKRNSRLTNNTCLLEIARIASGR